ncbi:MAG: hypothetical protein JKY34_15110 [Kordiimonadaceae bacterium]|nr:hypothetical protein [Kordiimonadaceae bacterium]
MTDSYIDYDAKVQDALRHVVRNVLIETANDGLPGDIIFMSHSKLMQTALIFQSIW